MKLDSNFALIIIIKPVQTDWQTNKKPKKQDPEKIGHDINCKMADRKLMIEN